jgi:hypothetical protein
LALVRLTTVQVTKLPLKHKTRKVGMICFAKPVQIEDLYTAQKAEFSINILYVRYVGLTKSQAYSNATTPSSRQRGCYIRAMTERFQLKKISGRETQGACRQDELNGGKPPLIKYLWH